MAGAKKPRHVDYLTGIFSASGLNPDKRRQSLHPYEHLYQVYSITYHIMLLISEIKLMEFAIALQNALAFFNQGPFKTSILR